MTRGFITIAENNNNTDFVRMAYSLALSLKFSQTNYNKLSIITSTPITEAKYIDVFDKIILVDADANWKDKSKSLDTTSLCASYFDHTPYDETIVLDADMIFPNDVSEWWDMFTKRINLIFTTQVKTFRGHKINNDYYRKVYTENNLPNIYTGLFYFKKNSIVKPFFDLVKQIFNNWEFFFNELKETHRPDFLSADIAYAIAYKILDLPDYSDYSIPTFTHMKSQLQDVGKIKEEWTKSLNIFITDKLEIKINNYIQLLPFHYHDKNFLTEELIKSYENFK